MQYIICNTTQHNTTQHNTIQYNTIQYNTIQYNTTLYYTILYYTILYYTILYYTILQHLSLSPAPGLRVRAGCDSKDFTWIHFLFCFLGGLAVTQRVCTFNFLTRLPGACSGGGQGDPPETLNGLTCNPLSLTW